MELDLQEILQQNIFSIGKYHVTIGGIITAILIVFFTRIAEFFINRVFLKRYFRQRQIDQGRSFAVGQIVKYLIYMIGVFIMIKHLFGSVSFLALGSAGLFVGIGLALQQTFTDFISGIILLVDRSAEVGDIIVIDSVVGQVKKIGLRTSEVYTRDRVSVIVPNSKLISNNFTNWSHNQEPARFHVDAGVAYKSNAEEVERILLSCAAEIKEILDNPPPTVHLMEFGDSSVNFRLYYFSHEFFFAERIKSDLRKTIFHQFRMNEIEIPFPQRDIWFKNNNQDDGGSPD